MGVFKKFVNLLFDESDADVIAEDELENIEFKEPKKEKTIKQEPVREDLYTYEEERTFERTDKVKTKEEKKKFVSIDLEDDAPQAKPEVKEKKTIVQQRPVLQKNEKKEFEFTPVISPIFGAKEEEKKKKEIKRKQSVDILKKSSSVKKKPNPLGTIISPYYGVSELEEFEEEAKEEIAAKEKAKQTPVETPSDDVEIKRMDEIEEINNVTLDEILVDDVKNDSEEDLMQISLFGESTPVHEADKETYKLKEEE